MIPERFLACDLFIVHLSFMWIYARYTSTPSQVLRTHDGQDSLLANPWHLGQFFLILRKSESFQEELADQFPFGGVDTGRFLRPVVNQRAEALR